MWYNIEFIYIPFNNIDFIGTPFNMTLTLVGLHSLWIELIDVLFNIIDLSMQYDIAPINNVPFNSYWIHWCFIWNIDWVELSINNASFNSIVYSKGHSIKHWVYWCPIWNIDWVKLSMNNTSFNSIMYSKGHSIKHRIHWCPTWNFDLSGIIH